MKIWILSKKQLFSYIVIICAVIAFFIWLLIPTGASNSLQDKPNAKSLAVKQLDYSPKEAKRKRAKDWQMIKQKTPYVLMYNKYFTNKETFNKQDELIQVRLRNKYIKQLNHSSNNVLNDRINSQLRQDADKIQRHTHASQVAIKIVNYSGFMAVDD